MRAFLFVIKNKEGLISMTNGIIKVGTFFSGIGSPEKALERLKREEHIKDYELEFFMVN